MADITWRTVPDLAALEAPWRELERRSSASFFQGWTWVGCQAGERFSDPLVLQAHERDRLVALALFNARPAWSWPGLPGPAPSRLHLGETGERARDAVFVEHNGPLLETGQEALLAPLLAAAMTLPIRGRMRLERPLVLGGVGDAVLLAARGLPAVCLRHQPRLAPFVDLQALPPGDFAATLGASTRAQLRRSARRYAEAGPLAVRRAADLPEALASFEAMAALHQASWIARGQAGAFADPAIMRFHRALIARGVPTGEVDLLHVAAGDRTIGYLYNVLSRPGAARHWVGNYQGGFAYATAEPHCKPGLTCHHLAIEFYRAEGRDVYDLLAGESRYKTSLAAAGTMLHWLEIAPDGSLAGLIASATVRLRQFGAATGPLWKTPASLAR